MHATFRFSLCALLTTLVVCAVPAWADVIVHGTRVIYPGAEHEATVRVESLGVQPVLVQTWIDDGDPRATPEEALVPFDMTPPLFRLEPGASQTLRILYDGEALPRDRESLYWLNVLEVPPRQEQVSRNLLQLNLRTRIKLIYRPATLSRRDAVVAPDALIWSLVDNPKGPGMALEVINPTPYYVNFSRVGIRADGREYQYSGVGMASPLSSTNAVFPLEGLTSRPVTAQVEFVFITDLGAKVARTAPMTL